MKTFISELKLSASTTESELSKTVSKLILDNRNHKHKQVELFIELILSKLKTCFPQEYEALEDKRILTELPCSFLSTLSSSLDSKSSVKQNSINLLHSFCDNFESEYDDFKSWSNCD